VALRALQEALAEHAAGAERDLRLDDVVAGAERIALGIEEGQHPLLLVVVQRLPGERRRDRGGDDDRRELPQRTPAAKNRAPPAISSINAGAQVRLAKHQRRGSRHQQRAARSGGGAGRCPRRGTAVEVAGQRQDQGDLHQLRRLQIDDAEIDPALRPHADRAGDLHRDKEARIDEIDEIGVAQPKRISVSATASISARQTAKRTSGRIAQGE
jgi:hypothetical protein